MSDYRLDYILHKDGQGSPLRTIVDFFVALIMTSVASGWFLYSFFQWFNPYVLVSSCAAALFVLWLWLHDLRLFVASLLISIVFCALVIFAPSGESFFYTARQYVLDFLSWISVSHAVPGLLLHPRFGVSLLAFFVVVSAMCVTFFIKVLRSPVLCGIFGVSAFMALGVIENIYPPPLLPTIAYLSVFLAGCCYFYSGFAFVRRDTKGSYLKWQVKTFALWFIPLGLVLAITFRMGGLTYKNPLFIEKMDTLMSQSTLSWFPASSTSPVRVSVQSGGVLSSSLDAVRLGGLRAIGRAPIFNVSPNSSPGKYYLKLNTFTSYTGKEWRKLGNSSFTAANFDNMPQSYPSDGIEPLRLTLSAFQATGQSIPAPLGVSSISCDNPSGTEISKNAFGEYKFSRGIKPSDRFNISFNAPRMELENGCSTAYSPSASPKAKAYFAAFGSDDTLELLSLPNELPQRVRNLAASLTAGFSSSYDKAAAICEYLKSSFSYTLSPPAYDGDFVDAFLFDGKQGYCTYFATAMTVLCRASNVSARYVEGYAVSIPTEATVTVTGENAHAWCEVYIPDFGWMVFDATAPDLLNINGSENTDPPKIPEEVPDTPPADPQPETPQPQPDTPVIAPVFPVEPGGSANHSGILIFIKAAAALLLKILLCVFLISLPYFYYRLRRRAYAKQCALYRSDNAAPYAMNAYSELLYFSKLLHVEKAAGETPGMHLRRLASVLDLSDLQMLTQAILCVDQAAYSPALPQIQPCLALAAVHQAAAAKIMEKYGAVIFILLWRRGK